MKGGMLVTMTRLEEAARRGALVIFAGAGVSAGAPTSLPGWKPLNAAIFRALRTRLERDLDTENWLAQPESFLESARNADRFPPDYQAQVIEEMCGERYFRALQALDVDVTNAGHEGIAALTASGAVRAIVTTNFDCLIERALDLRGIAYEAVFDTEGFIRLRDRLAAGGDGPIPVIKIHGSVSEHLSMIDTLKQRRKGRSRAIEECLDPLYSGYWLYLGFSAADLETDRDYLGLVSGASRSSGATYVAYPGRRELGAGAQSLMGAYGELGSVVVADVGSYLAKIGKGIGVPETTVNLNVTKSGNEEFEEKLAAWASGLSMAATGLCLAAIMEAAGQSEPAVRVLDKLVRKEIYEERGTPDFHALQLQYGRLGAAFGRFINVPDLNGYASNASVETVQSLLRLQETECASRAMGWMPCLYLWLNKGEAAMGLAAGTMRGFSTNEWGSLTPPNDEAAVDAWLAAAQVCLVNTHPRTIEVMNATFPEALLRARRSGDVVRTARVVALFLLARAETHDDVPALARQYTAEINDVRRVGDGFAIGFLALALGRWHTGPGGLSLARQTNDLKTIAQRAQQYLQTADLHFQNQGMDPWLLFAAIQHAKALSDLQYFDAVNEVLNRTAPELDRFPIFVSHVREAAGQIQLSIGDSNAPANFRSAIEAAEESGLHLRRDLMIEHYGAQAGVARKTSPAPSSRTPATGSRKSSPSGGKP
jgi:SIR2-like domain